MGFRSSRERCTSQGAGASAKSCASVLRSAALANRGQSLRILGVSEHWRDRSLQIPPMSPTTRRCCFCRAGTLLSSQGCEAFRATVLKCFGLGRSTLPETLPRKVRPASRCFAAVRRRTLGKGESVPFLPTFRCLASWR